MADNLILGCLKNLLEPKTSPQPGRYLQSYLVLGMASPAIVYISYGCTDPNFLTQF